MTFQIIFQKTEKSIYNCFWGAQKCIRNFIYKYYYKDGYLFTSKHNIYFWKTSGMESFADEVTEKASRNGSASYCRFMKQQIMPLSLITSYMFVIEVLVLLKS